MAFLDELGLERLWTNIIGRLNDFVQTDRKINNKSLASDVTLTYADVNADQSGAAASALESANGYTDTKIEENLVTPADIDIICGFSAGDDNDDENDTAGSGAPR